MSNSPGHDAEHWKQKYYDQLDQLEQKEQHWTGLESILKKTISRLSLAAEGNHDQVDRHVQDIRAAVKDRINLHRLELILEDLSAVLARLEESRVAPDRQAVSVLEQLLENLQLPRAADRQRQKLLKQVAKANDDQKQDLLGQVTSLLKTSLQAVSQEEQNKGGFFAKLLGSSNDGMSERDVAAIVQVLSHVLQLLPWPPVLMDEADQLVKGMAATNSEKAISQQVEVCEQLMQRWRILPVETTVQSPEINATPEPVQARQPDRDSRASAVIEQRDYFCQLLQKLDDPLLNSQLREQLYRSAQGIQQEQQLAELTEQLVQQLKSANRSMTPGGVRSEVGQVEQPSSQELLIRLLEQLIVPLEMQADVETMKHRLEDDIAVEDWKQLLKDVARLINAIRSQMQQEKHEFEHFLQQLTGRLMEMDGFLRQESESLNSAEQQGQAFDQTVKGQVQNMRDDVGQASSLDELKLHVEKRLDEMAEHIRLYRDTENQRVQDAQSNVEQMQHRMADLEQESGKLKEIIVTKNRQAMIDVLTEIPNRLAYEQKVEEEIARWKRFNKPLTLGIWDVDLFKKVNDSYGHKAGDKVLKTIAQLLISRIRETDFLARYGGEEFVMLLPGSNEQETLALVNELRIKVEECGFHYHGERVVITASCGISGFHEGDSLAQVFERADKALYQAKENGRNQCVIAS